MKDIEIKELTKNEKNRQQKTINLIASENYVSKDVLEALGSVFTNKYAEGYPKARYYGGNQYADELELMAQKRAIKLFKLKENDWSVNVQSLSGSPANLAVYMALVPFGEKIMGLSLSHGGHLTHGHKVSSSGKFWQAISYELDKETELLDYEKIKLQVVEEKPKLIIVGYTAYSRIIDWKKFKEIADSVGAYLHVDMSHVSGLIAGGMYPSPFPYADTVMTTTHKTLRGPRGALIFSRKDTRNLPQKIDKAVFPGLQGGPHLNQIAAIAVALKEAKTEEFKKYIKAVVENSKILSRELKKLGWRIISGGTETHLFLMDTWKNGEGIDGNKASVLLEKNNIIVNKNTIPFDTLKPNCPSGIRIGTAAETTKGKNKEDMLKIANNIDNILKGAK